MLRDHLVCGIGDSRIQKQLLAEPNLTLDKVLELTLVQESAEQNAAQLQAPSQTATQVNKLGGHPNPKASNGKKSFGTLPSVWWKTHAKRLFIQGSRMPQMQEKRAPGLSMPLQDKTNSIECSTSTS